MPTPRIIPALDGYPLAATLFPGDAEQVVVINPAVGVRQTFYAPFAGYLAARGPTVVTYDYRGLGASAPATLRGFDAALHDWGERDMAGVFAWVQQHHPHARTAAVGHSAGGQLLGLVPHAGEVVAMLTVSSQSGYVGHWPGLQRLGLEMVWRLLVPATVWVFGYYPWRLLGGPLPGPMALEWARWALDPGYLRGAAARPATRHFDAFAAPWLAYSIADDRFAPQVAVDALAAFYPNARVERRHLEPAALGLDRLGHFGFFRPRHEALLWAPAVAWLLEALG